MPGLLTVIASTQPKALGKTFHLDGEGRLMKETAAQLASGSYEVKAFADGPGLVQLLSGFTPAQALCSSVPSDGSEVGRIVRRAALKANPGAIARTKDAFHFPSGQPGLLVLDFDPPKLGPVLTRDELWQAVLSVAPGLAKGLVVWWTSASSCIFNGEAEIAGVKGQRLYIGIQDLSDTPRALEVLSARLDLAGHLRIEVSESGALLQRGLVDLAMKQTARLDFGPAGSICKPPLEQRRGPPVLLANGGFVDSLSVLPDLTAEERGAHDALLAEAKEARREEATAARQRWCAARVAEGLPALMTQGLSAAEAEERLTRTLEAAYGGTLLGAFVLTVAHADGRQERVSVEHVLSHRDDYHQLDCLVPLHEEHRGGSPDARLYLMGSSPIAYSLDDGGSVWRLRRQTERIEVARGQRGALVETLASWASSQDDLFLTDAGPVQVADGRAIPLSDLRLTLLIAQRTAVFARGKNGDVPTDIQRDVAQLVLCALT